MPLYTIRINVQDLAPLDGVTPFDPNAPGVTVEKGVGPNADLGIIDVTLPVGMAFGVFDPGVLTDLQDKIYSMINLTVFSLGNPVHVAGSDVKIQSPAIAGASVDTQSVDLAGTTGVFGSLSKLFPIDHKIVFNTLADGAGAGPHLLQFSLCSIDPDDCAQVAAAEACCNGNGNGAEPCCGPQYLSQRMFAAYAEQYTTGQAFSVDLDASVCGQPPGNPGILLAVIRPSFFAGPPGTPPVVVSAEVDPVNNIARISIDATLATDGSYVLELTNDCGCCFLIPLEGTSE